MKTNALCKAFAAMTAIAGFAVAAHAVKAGGGIADRKAVRVRQ